MLRLTYVGHATVLIEMDGLRILTNPLLTRWPGPLRRQLGPVDPGWLRDLDGVRVMLSHLHHDHLHLPSLARLGRETRLVVAGSALMGWVGRHLQAAEWWLSFNTRFDMLSAGPILPAGRQPWLWLAETTALIGLVSVVFVQTLPGVSAPPLQIVFAVGAVVVANSLVSHWFAQRRTHWSSTLVEFVVMAAINYMIATFYIALMPFLNVRTGIIQLLFLTLLLTLIVTLHDHFRPIHDQYVALAVGDDADDRLDERGVPALAVEGRD